MRQQVGEEIEQFEIVFGHEQRVGVRFSRCVFWRIVGRFLSSCRCDEEIFGVFLFLGVGVDVVEG